MRIPQGDLRLRLLTDRIAQRLLASRELARLAYIAKDGTPRVIPMLFQWTGDEIVFGAYAGSPKLASMRRHPDVAITIDVAGPPPEVLLIRGRADIGPVGDIVAEYAWSARTTGSSRPTSSAGSPATGSGSMPTSVPAAI